MKRQRASLMSSWAFIALLANAAIGGWYGVTTRGQIRKSLSFQREGAETLQEHADLCRSELKAGRLSNADFCLGKLSHGLYLTARNISKAERDTR